MHRLAGYAKPLFAAIWIAAATATFSLVLAGAARAGDPGSGSCDPTVNPSCTVGVVVPGGPGGQGGGTGAASGSCQNTDPHNGCDPCPSDAYLGERPPAVSATCAAYLQNQYCSAIEGDALGGLGVPTWNDVPPAVMASLNQQFVAAGCPPVITTAALADRAFKTIHFPPPSGHRSPAESQAYNGSPFTWVNLWTYFWTDPGTWKTLTATASAGGMSATVTAKPVELVFDPGDGSPAVSCHGPGRPWTAADANSVPSSGACGFRYRHVTPGLITSTQTIVWQITWTGTGDMGGQIPSLSTSTSGQLRVMQIETVVTR